ncbi:Abi family protein [Streptococcus ruminantium]|uniref:Abi family protein n=1 Tax=Streptococcus ruminantium TaxID=1917441 RepID=UPI001F43788C|nr:Abi family protein [Streptococcus ruminantium]BDD37951.1 abortive infection bacteriophage resistance protein [Streptococcus ruminantium]
MNTPIALEWEKQIDLFKQRGMDIGDAKLNQEKLQHISYYRLKEFARPLAKISKKNGYTDISYDGITFKQVLTRYYQDKNLRINLLHAIEKIEVSLKTKVSYILGKNYGAFGYLNFSNWTNRTKFKKFEIEKQQYYFKSKLLKTIELSNHSELKNVQNLNSDGFPSVWLTIDMLMFGELINLIDLMSKNNKKQLASFYNCSVKELLSWIKCLNFIRNICAHNSNILDIQLQTTPVKNIDWDNHLFVISGKKGNRTTNRLAIVIFIIIDLVAQINPKYDWKKITSNLKTIVKSNPQNAHLLGFKDEKTVENLYEYIQSKKTN